MGSGNIQSGLMRHYLLYPTKYRASWSGSYGYLYLLWLTKQKFSLFDFYMFNAHILTYLQFLSAAEGQRPRNYLSQFLDSSFNLCIINFHHCATLSVTPPSLSLLPHSLSPSSLSLSPSSLSLSLLTLSLSLLPHSLSLICTKIFGQKQLSLSLSFSSLSPLSHSPPYVSLYHYISLSHSSLMHYQLPPPCNPHIVFLFP